MTGQSELSAPRGYLDRARTMRSNSSARPASVATVIAANLSITAIGVLIIELLFGNWLRPNLINRLHLIRDVKLTYAVREPYSSSARQVMYRRDASGLRGPYKDPAHIDVLTIGGSTTDQRNITEGETWQDVIVQTLAEKGKTVTIANAGVDGQSTVGHLKDFDWWFPAIPGFQPKYVLLYVGINDLYVAGARTFDDLADDPSTMLGRVRTSLKQRSALYALFVKLRGLYFAHQVFAAYHRTVDFDQLVWVREPRLHNHAGLIAEQLDAYQGRLETLLSKVRGIGASPICVTQPARWYKFSQGMLGAVDPKTKSDDGIGYLNHYRGQPVNGLDYYALLSLVNERTRQVCGKNSALTLDPARDLAWDDYDYFDFTHNTPRGTRKLGVYLATGLDRLF